MKIRKPINSAPLCCADAPLIARACLALFALACLFATGCSQKAEPEKAAAEGEKGSKPESRVQHGTNGEVLIKLDAATQKLMGLETSPLNPGQLKPEVKAYGRVLDVSSLAASVAELATAEAAAQASEAELKRLTTLAAQNNASERALQAAQATATHDQTQLAATRLRLLSSWGTAIAQYKDLPGLVQSLSSLVTALVQLELPAGQPLNGEPAGARLLTLTDESQPIQAQYLGPAAFVDAQMQARGFLFLVESNQNRLAPGASVTGFISVPGEPKAGVILPRSAVVRFNSATWVYRQNGEQTFERVEVALGPPLTEGWFVSDGLKAAEKVVTVGAQQLLSEELKGQGGEE